MNVHFPAPTEANEDGLLAIGGDLSPQTLLNAYRQACFPWYSEDQPILWWSPESRMILHCEEFYCSKRLQRRLKQGRYSFTWDKAFEAVISQCIDVHSQNSGGTWILPAMKDAYIALHQQGHAHSVEVWDSDELIGGLYGVLLNQVFFAESMFSIQRDASKMAIAHLVEIGQEAAWKCIDCQFYTKHLSSLGAKEIPRSVLLSYCGYEKD